MTSRTHSPALTRTLRLPATDTDPVRLERSIVRAVYIFGVVVALSTGVYIAYAQNIDEMPGPVPQFVVNNTPGLP